MKDYQINQVCLDCGKKHGQGDKTNFGMWEATCDICQKETWCADARHDFGIGISEREFELSNSV